MLWFINLMYPLVLEALILISSFTITLLTMKGFGANVEKYSKKVISYFMLFFAITIGVTLFYTQLLQF